MTVNLGMIGQLVDQQTTLLDINDFFTALNNKAIDIRDNYPGNLGARVLSLVQMVVSAVAVVFSVLAMVLMPIFAICFSGRVVAREWARGFAAMVGAHLYQIPASFVGVFFPSTLISGTGFQEMTEGARGLGRQFNNPGPGIQGLNQALNTFRVRFNF
jgi:hypothetical protein